MLALHRVERQQMPVRRTEGRGRAGGGLSGLDTSLVSGVGKARENASLYAAEILERAITVPRKRWYNVFKRAS